MCGIAGVVSRDLANNSSAVRNMCNALVHRGPDDEGYFDEPGAHLGMRRLAVIDVEHGKQPIFNEDGTVVTVLNGEIYNHLDLRKDLEGKGHRFRTNSDTESLVHLYEEYGPDLLNHLRGMFSLAIWDRRAKTLVLARDRVGKKPLFYAEIRGQLWFASELKGLLAAKVIAPEMDPVAIDQFLSYQYVPHPRSAVAGVRKLPPAHRLIWRDGRMSVDRYWNLEYRDARSMVRPDEDAAAEEFRERLLEATRIRMLSERPLGAFLSGGLDSSAVVASMARQTSGTVSTFSIGFDNAAFNELPFARRVAHIYGTEHHELVIEPHVEALLPRLAAVFDEPFADSSAVPSFYVAEAASKQVVVALNGDGGDESFGGYTRYLSRHADFRDLQIPSGPARAAGAVGTLVERSALDSSSLYRAGRGLLKYADASPAARYARSMSYFLPEEKALLYQAPFAESLADSDCYGPYASVYSRSRFTDPINRLLAMDEALYLPGDLLTKVDMTSMAVSLEARSPLLDQEMMVWAAGLPGDLKVRGDQTKFIMKKGLEPWLPQDLIHRPKKGFAVPRDEWLRGPLQPMVQDVLLNPSAAIYSYLRHKEVSRLVRLQATAPGLGSKVYALLMLELWHKEVLQGAGPYAG